MSIADFIDPKWREELTRQLNERRAIVSRGVSCDQEGFSFSRHASKLCEHLQLSGEWAEAYEVLRKSISVLTPFEKNAAVAYGLADLKVKLAAQLHDVGKYTEAVEYTKQAASTYTAFPSSHLLCCDATFALAACYVDTANAYLMQGDYNQCDDFCAKAMIALDHAAQDPRPNTNGILQRRIQAMECMANRAEASGDIERARDIDLVIFKYAKQPSELQEAWINAWIIDSYRRVLDNPGAKSDWEATIGKVRQGYGRLIQTRRGRTPDSAHIVKGYIRALRAVADKQSGQLDEMETKVNAMLDEMRRFTDA